MARVFAPTPGWPFITRETVIGETPALAATSITVTPRPGRSPLATRAPFAIA